MGWRLWIGGSSEAQIYGELSFIITAILVWRFVMPSLYVLNRLPVLLANLIIPGRRVIMQRVQCAMIIRGPLLIREFHPHCRRAHDLISRLLHTSGLVVMH